LEWNSLKATFLNIKKKIINKQQLYNTPLLQVAFLVLQNFFLYDFLKMPALEILLVFKGFLRYFVVKIINVWVRSEGILISKINNPTPTIFFRFSFADFL
jgi:hypothetical protein